MAVISKVLLHSRSSSGIFHRVRPEGHLRCHGHSQKSTAHRFLKHLERERYLIRPEAGVYLIGPHHNCRRCRRALIGGQRFKQPPAVYFGSCGSQLKKRSICCSRPWDSALRRCDGEPARTPNLIARWRSPCTAHHGTRQSAGGFFTRRTTREYFEHELHSSQRLLEPF
jgi:hypothetical protein